MPDFDPNVAASIAAENTSQGSQERPAAYTSLQLLEEMCGRVAA